jgi:hypothetical protein
VVVSLLPNPLTRADRALLRALAGWGGLDGGRFWAVFTPPWRDRLRDGWLEGVPLPEAAREGLRAEHAAEALPDLSRIHPSWFVRALQDESPAVRRAVAALAPEPARSAIRHALNFPDVELEPDRPPHPEAIKWVLALWSERLVGGLPRRDDDPPVIVALSRCTQRSLHRLFLMIGLAKRAYALTEWEGSDDSVDLPRRARDRARIEEFRRRWGEADPRLAQVARGDLAAGPRGQVMPWLGLLTIGRLLTTADPHRARWALQHLPYSDAKIIRP